MDIKIKRGDVQWRIWEVAPSQMDVQFPRTAVKSAGRDIARMTWDFYSIILDFPTEDLDFQSWSLEVTFEKIEVIFCEKDVYFRKRDV